ncbi:hypothetical protein VTJ83DRAFT_7429 [Remersonia thermophila]|uniref:C2H2-type domain-containing protein n=1 Tax=Remersonia thermophila TaxID=72144 RepID=A0ABR4D4J1_9PEZI
MGQTELVYLRSSDGAQVPDGVWMMERPAGMARTQSQDTNLTESLTISTSASGNSFDSGTEYPFYATYALPTLIYPSGGESPPTASPTSSQGTDLFAFDSQFWPFGSPLMIDQSYPEGFLPKPEPSDLKLLLSTTGTQYAPVDLPCHTVAVPSSRGGLLDTSTSGAEEAARSDMDLCLLATGSQHAMVEYEAAYPGSFLPQPLDASISSAEDASPSPTGYGADLTSLGIMLPGAGAELAFIKVEEDAFRGYQIPGVETAGRAYLESPARSCADEKSTPTAARPAAASRPPMQAIENTNIPRGTARPDHISPSPSATFNENKEKARYRCRIPGCDRGASRLADLLRHEHTVHSASLSPDGSGGAGLANNKTRRYVCDYKMCARHADPFYRQDHFRDHLRLFHKEDIPRRGARSECKLWWQSRAPYAVARGWWRCSKCLSRVVLKKHGFTCHGCGRTCEKQRQEYRIKLQDKPPALTARCAFPVDSNAVTKSVAVST